MSMTHRQSRAICSCCWLGQGTRPLATSRPPIYSQQTRITRARSLSIPSPAHRTAVSSILQGRPTPRISTFSQARLSSNPAIFFKHDGGREDGSFTVSVTDGIAPPQTVTVAQPMNRPIDITSTPLVVDEQSPYGTIVGRFTGIEMESTGFQLGYSLVDDAGGRFFLGAAFLGVLNGSLLDFEQAASHTIVVRATNVEGFFYDEAFTVTIRDVSPDILTGGTGPDTLGGGATADIINGLAGDDVLVGGGG